MAVDHDAVDGIVVGRRVNVARVVGLGSFPHVLFEDVSDAAGFGPEHGAGGFEEAGGAAVGDVVLLRRLVSSVLGA